MMARHGVMLASFFVQPQAPAGALRPEVLHLHFQRGVDAGEGIGEVAIKAALIGYRIPLSGALIGRP
jgi:hypothetical protein